MNQSVKCIFNFFHWKSEPVAFLVEAPHAVLVTSAAFSVRLVEFLGTKTFSLCSSAQIPGSLSVKKSLYDLFITLENMLVTSPSVCCC